MAEEEQREVTFRAASPVLHRDAPSHNSSPAGTSRCPNWKCLLPRGEASLAGDMRGSDDPNPPMLRPIGRRQSVTTTFTHSFFFCVLRRKENSRRRKDRRSNTTYRDRLGKQFTHLSSAITQLITDHFVHFILFIIIITHYFPPMASLSAAHQSQHGTTAYRHFHQLNQSAVSGIVPTQLPLLFPSLAPSVDVSSVDPSSSVHHNLLLNHFLLSSAPSTSSSLLNPFTRSSLRPPYHSQTPHWLNLDGMAPLVKQFPSAAESFADRSQPQAKELGQQNQQQQCSVSSGVSSFSFSSSVSADSDGRSCSSGSCSGTHSQIQTAQTTVQQHQRPQQIEPTQQKQKKLLVRDEAYWERRRKNNDAAKRSRDSRRKKEDEVAVRAVVLEQENLQLRFEVERLRTEIERHRIVAFGDTLIAATAENVGETSMGKMPISSAAITQLTTAATAMGMAKPILNT